MPNEILNIQHTITQLQNVEKVQAVGQQREQYQQKTEAIHMQAEKELEQTIVQISEEAEKILLQDEGQKKEGKWEGKKRKKSDADVNDAKDEDDENIVDILV